MKSNSNTKSNKSSAEGNIPLLSIIKGVFVALLCTLMFTMVVVLLSMFTEIADGILAPIDVIAKQVAVVIGVFVAVNSKMKGWLTGLFVGLLFAVFSFCIFSVMNGTFILDQALGMSILFSAILGVISGIIGVNLKKY